MHSATNLVRVTSTPRAVMAVALVVVLLLVGSASASFAAQGPVGLGTAENFSILAGSTITNTGPTTITGDVGLHPGSSVTGFGSVTMTGELHIADAVAEQAKTDLVTAYNDAAGRQPVTTTSTELGGQTLAPGVYTSASGTFGMTGTLTLDAAGDGNAVFIFQMPTTLVTAADSSVNLINGADACNVYWQVGSSATLGTRTSFKGNILALTSISLTTGAVIEGRALAQNGAVTLDTNTLTRATCTPPPTDDTPVDDTPTDDTPTDDPPTDDPPTDDTPTDGTPTDGTPTDGTPTDGTPTIGTPTDDTPTIGTPTVATPTVTGGTPTTAGGTPTGDTPTGDTPTGDTPTGDTPTGDTPTGDTPTGDTPTGDTPTGDTPPLRTTPPVGGVPAGGGSTASGQNAVLLALATGLLLLSATGVVAARPRRAGK